MIGSTRPIGDYPPVLVLFGGPSGPVGPLVTVQIPQGASVEHIGDILAVLHFEDLRDVILVGRGGSRFHSARRLKIGLKWCGAVSLLLLLLQVEQVNQAVLGHLVLE